MKHVSARPEHEVLRRGLMDYIAERHPELPGEDVLAVVAQLLGRLVVMQDPDGVRSGAVLDTVNGNFVIGQRQASAALGKGRTRH